jgi:uncharacterized protein YkwD
MNIQTPQHTRSARFSQSLSLVLFFVVSLVLCHPVAAQGVDSRPSARLVTATAYSRPRQVTSILDAEPSPEKASISSLGHANDIERRAFEKTNLVRRQNGLAPLAWDAELCRLARINSENMARRGYFSHVTPEGLRLRDRAREVGILHFSLLGENIAYNQGYDDPGAFAVESWMVSPGHRENILSREFQASAIGSFVTNDGSVFLTQVFITR